MLHDFDYLILWLIFSFLFSILKNIDFLQNYRLHSINLDTLYFVIYVLLPRVYTYNYAYISFQFLNLYFVS